MKVNRTYGMVFVFAAAASGLLVLGGLLASRYLGDSQATVDVGRLEDSSSERTDNRTSPAPPLSSKDDAQLASDDEDAPGHSQSESLQAGGETAAPGVDWSNLEEVRAFVRANPDLRSINLEELGAAATITDEAFCALMQLPHLEELDMSGASQISNEGIRCLRDAGALRRLTANRISGGDETYRIFRELTSLRELHLGRFRLSDEGLDALASMHWLDSLELRKMTVSKPSQRHPAEGPDPDSHFVTAEGVRSLASLRSLTRLTLSHSFYHDGVGFDGSELVDVLLANPHLRELDIPFYRYFTSDDFIEASSTLRRVEYANLYHTGIRGPALEILDSGWSLRWLTLSSFVSDDDLARIARVPSMEGLSLIGCKGITSEGVQHLASLSRLNTLHLVASDKVGDDAVERLAAMPLLESLDLSGCTGLTAKSLDALVRTPSLSFLRVHGIPGITEDDVSRFREQRPDVTVRTLQLGRDPEYPGQRWQGVIGPHSNR